jgi:hypothetical protein
MLRIVAFTLVAALAGCFSEPADDALDTVDCPDEIDQTPYTHDTGVSLD